MLAPWIVRRLDAPLIVTIYAWVATAATFLLLLADSVWLVGLLGALAFIPVAAVNAALMAQGVTRAPEHIQGRAVAATIQLTALLQPAGPALAGLLLDVTGVRLSIVAYGSATLVLALIATLTPVLRRGQ